MPLLLNSRSLRNDNKPGIANQKIVRKLHRNRHGNTLHRTQPLHPAIHTFAEPMHHRACLIQMPQRHFCRRQFQVRKAVHLLGVRTAIRFGDLQRVTLRPARP